MKIAFSRYSETQHMALAGRSWAHSRALERVEAEQNWNNAMAAVRIEFEHGFGDVTRVWPFINAWWKLKVYGSPVGSYYCVAVLLINALKFELYQA
jgi:hypothetical protein